MSDCRNHWWKSGSIYFVDIGIRRLPIISYTLVFRVLRDFLAKYMANCFIHHVEDGLRVHPRIFP
jgi:hypothetical protein